MELKKKRNKLMPVVIVLLVIVILLGLRISFFSDCKCESEAIVSKQDTNLIDTNSSLSLVDIYNLLNKIIINDVKFYEYFNNNFNKDTPLLKPEMNDELKNFIAFSNMNKNKIKDLKFNESDLISSYEEVFGSDVPYKVSSFKTCSDYTYNKDTKVFEGKKDSKCSDSTYSLKYQLIDAVKTGDTISTKVVIAYCGTLNNTKGCFNTSNNLVKDIDSTMLLDNMDKLNNYKVTFKLDPKTATFVFDSFEKLSK